MALLADFLSLTPPTLLAISPDLRRRKPVDLLAQWTLALSVLQPLVLLVVVGGPALVRPVVTGALGRLIA